MALEQISRHEFLFEPGPLGIHEHPRIFDAVVMDPDNPAVPEIDEGRVGKAGVGGFTEVALQSGLTAIIAMPNESLRLPDPKDPNQTITVPYPISNRNRMLAAANVAATQSYVPIGLFVGIDPVDIRSFDLTQVRSNFQLTKDLSMACKIYGAETTGGNNIDVQIIPGVIREFVESNPGKPVVLHLEDENVGKVLGAVIKINGGKEWPIHIAHVSSREELEAVVLAKQEGMNVTCEVTPHHLFMTDDQTSRPDGLGCMKPTLKTKADVDFLRRNFKKYIDMIGTDCAPHAFSEKEQGTFGLSNHPSLLNLFMSAALDSDQEWIDLEDVYDKLSVQTYDRFNFPYLGSSVVYATYTYPLANSRYAETDPFAGNYSAPGAVTISVTGLGTSFQRTESGKSQIQRGQPIYRNLITPERQKA